MKINKIKNMPSFFLKFVITITSLAFLSLHQPTSANEISDKKIIKLAAFDYPPFIKFRDEKNHDGIASDIINEAFIRIKRPIQIDLYPLSRSMFLFDSGLVDGFFTIKRTREREEKFIFSNEPIITQDYVIFVRSNSTLKFNGDLSTLSDISIGIMVNSSYGKIFDELALRGSLKKLEVAQNHELNFKKLLANRMDAIICSRAVGLNIAKKLKIYNFVKIIGPPVESTNSYIAFKKNNENEKLILEIDRVIAAMRKDGSIDRINKKYKDD